MKKELNLEKSYRLKGKVLEFNLYSNNEYSSQKELEKSSVFNGISFAMYLKFRCQDKMSDYGFFWRSACLFSLLWKKQSVVFRMFVVCIFLHSGSIWRFTLLNLHIQPEWGKIRTRKNSKYGHFLRSVSYFGDLASPGLYWLYYIKFILSLLTPSLFIISN